MIAVDRRRSIDTTMTVHLEQGLSDMSDPVLLDLFERRVSAATAAVLRRLEKGEAVVLSIGDSVFPVERRRAGARRLLEPLALVRPVGEGE